MPTTPTPRRIAGVLFALAATLASVTGCASVTRTSAAQGAQPVATSSGVSEQPSQSAENISVSYPISLPSGFITFGGIASDLHGGIWAFAQGADADGALNEAALHWNQAGDLLDKVDLVSLGDNIRTGADSPVIVDRTGAVWVGVRHWLVKIVADKPQLVSLPGVSEPSNDSGLQVAPTNAANSDPEEFANVESLALDPDGNVVVGRRLASALQVVNTSSNVVTSINLPVGTQLGGAARDVVGDGSAPVAVSLYGGNKGFLAAQLGHAGWNETADCPAMTLSMGEGSLAVGGPGCAYDTTAGLAGGPHDVAPAAIGLADSPMVDVAQIDQRSYLADTHDGTYVVTGSSSIGPLDLGSIELGPSSVIGGHGPRTVPITVGNKTVSAGGGRLWFLPSQGGSRLGLIAIN